MRNYFPIKSRHSRESARGGGNPVFFIVKDNGFPITDSGMIWNKILFLKFLPIFLCLIFLLGCSRENDRIKDAVMKYDTLLAEGYRNLNMNPLVQAATEKRALKAYYHMAALGEARIKMDAKLKKIAFSNVKLISGDKAEAITDEIWDYIYLNLDSGKPLFDNTVTYRLKYILEKKSGNWLVADINIEKADDKKEFPDIFHRPMNDAAGKRMKKPGAK